MILDNGNIMKCCLKVEDFVRWSGEIIEDHLVWKELYDYLSIERKYKISYISIVKNKKYCQLDIDSNLSFCYPSEVLYLINYKKYISEKYGLR